MQINSNENGPLALLSFLSQNSNNNYNLSFLENRQNELTRLINFINVLNNLNIQIKDLKQIHEILTFFLNVAKINNNQGQKIDFTKNSLLFSQVKQNDEGENKLYENPNENKEKNLEEKKNINEIKNDNENKENQKQGMKNTNSMSTGSQEKNNENTLRDSYFPNANYAYNRFIEIPNVNYEESKDEEKEKYNSENEGNF